MPKVPTAQEAGLGRARVQPVDIPRQSAELPALRVPRDESGDRLAGLGRAVSDLGGGLGGIALDLAERERRQHRQALLKEAETASLGAVEQLLRHPEGGFLGRQGRDALLAREATLQQLDRIGRRALEGLEPALQPAFETLWAGQRKRAAEQIDAHGQGQFAAWLDRVDLEQIGLARRQAAASGGAPEPLGEALARGRDGLAGLAERHGWSPGRLGEAERSLRSGLYAEVVRSLLERGALGTAWAHYRGVADELTEGDARALRPLLEQARRQAGEQARSAAAERLLSEWEAKGLDLEQRRERASALRGPALRAATLRRLDRREAVRARRERERNRRALAEARAAVEKGVLPEDLLLGTRLPLSEPQLQALDAWADRLAAGERPTSDLPALHRLRRLAAEEPEAFARLDLFTEARNRLDDQDYGALERLQAAVIARGEGRANGAQLALLDREEEIRGAIAAD